MLFWARFIFICLMAILGPLVTFAQEFEDDSEYEYEYVYVDEDGNEIVDDTELNEAEEDTVFLEDENNSINDNADNGNDELFIVEDDIQEQKEIPIAETPKVVQKIETQDLFSKIKYGQKYKLSDVEGWIYNTNNVNECLENGKTMLLQMVSSSSNLGAINLLIDRGADLVTSCKPSYNVLFIAAQDNQSPAVVDLLINKGADIVLKDFENNSVLGVASASNPNEAVITTLLEYGLNANDKNNFGYTSLMLAVHYNNMSVIKELVKSGANVNLRDKEGRTALMAAAVRGNDEIMQFLIKNDADIRAVDKNNMSVLDYYNKNRYLKDSEFKVNKFASPSENLYSKYKYITDNHHKYNKKLKESVWKDNAFEDVNDAVFRLADINVVDKDKCTPLLNATRKKQPIDVLKVLVEGGADVNMGCLGGLTPLMYISLGAKSFEDAKDATNKLKLLNNYKLDINKKDKDGNNALMYALGNKDDANYILNLLMLDADVNVINNNGDSPLWVAFKKQLPIKTIELLIQYGADVNLKAKNGENLLWYLLRTGGDEESIILLLESGIDTSVTNFAGKTPLWQMLLTGGNANLLNAFIRFEKDINKPNAKGDTPLLYAVKNDFPPEIIRTLLSNGADPEYRDVNGMNMMDIISQNQFFEDTIKEQTREDVLNQW